MRIRIKGILTFLLAAGVLCGFSMETAAQKKQRKDADTLSFPDLYLDTVNVKKTSFINDYSMIGIQGGAGLSEVLWNPSYNQKFRFSPYEVGIFYTRYGKMFGYMPYFGIQAGVVYGKQGYQFKADKETGWVTKLSGATGAAFSYIDMPVMAHAHVDFWKMKLTINLGYFLGYRLTIDRYGDDVADDKRHCFEPYEYRFDYGLRGGIGFGFVFDPIEIHIGATYKQSLRSLYKADYYSEYYYRYAYPMNIIISAGIHYQITRRVGKTRKELKAQAREEIFNPQFEK